MEETIQKKTKTQAAVPPRPNLKQLFDAGVPIKRANFFSAVNNADGTPENYFSALSDAPARRVEMAIIPNGTIVCRQKTTKGEIRYFLAGPANVISAYES